jgi:hypothetical protein
MVSLKTVKYALGAAALMLSVALVSTPAHAEWTEWWKSSDGSVTLWHNDSDTSPVKFAVMVEKDGKFGVSFSENLVHAILEKIEGGSNPNPDDPNNGRGTERKDIASMIEHTKGVNWIVPVNPEDSPIGGAINGHGGGKIPHWNPGEDSGGGGNTSNPQNSRPNDAINAKRDAAIEKALELAARDAAKGSQGMFDGSEGGTETWTGFNTHGPKKNQNDGKNQGDRGDSSSTGDDYRPDIPKGEDLGPKPEVVNPAFKGGRGSGKVKVGHAGKLNVETVKKNEGTGGKASGGTTSSLMSPGLLEGGGGFAFNGPAAAAGGGHAVRAAR